MHYIKRGDYGRLRCVSGNTVVYEDNSGNLVTSGTVLDSNIDAYSTISGFGWRGYDFMTISQNQSGRFNAYAMFRPDVTAAASVGVTLDSPKFLYDDTKVSGSNGQTRYLLVYSIENTANANSSGESTLVSYGMAYKTATLPYQGNTVTLHDIPRSDNYSDIDAPHLISLYRAVPPDLNTFYLVKTISGAEQTGLTFNYVDTMTDTDLITKARYYESDGVVAMNRPPKHSCSCLIGNTAYYGNIAVYDGDSGYNAQYIEQPYSIIQSMDGNPSMARDSFLLEVDEVVTGLSSIASSLIVFTTNKVYRYDGKYRNDGSGSYSRKVISEETGCISHASIVSTGQVVYFCGSNGVYMTDGYQVSKISVTGKYDISTTYESLIADYSGSDASVPTDIYRNKVTGHYDLSKDCIYWTMCNGTTQSNELLVYDMYNKMFSQFGGNGAEYSALLIDDGFLTGGSGGDIMRYHSDYDQDLIVKSPVTYDYIPFVARTSATDFGDPSIKKWVQALTVTATADSKIAIKTLSYNDNGSSGKHMKPIVIDSVLLWRDVNMLWRDAALIWRTPPTRSFRRHFPKRGMRCRYKQVEFRPAVSQQYSSVAHGTATVSYLVEGDPANFRVVLDDSNIVWPTDCIGYEIRFADDGYTVGHHIRAFDGANSDLSVDGGGAVPSTGTAWKIYGIRKKQSFKIENMTYQFAPLQNVGANYRGENE